jgi:hypothetical protein
MENPFKYVRTFENFVANQPQRTPSPSPNPSQPTTDPGRVPHPGVRPSDPDRRYKPAVDPKPKAETEISVEELLGLVNVYTSDEQKKQLNDYYAKRN